MPDSELNMLDESLKMLEQELEGIKRYQRYVADLMGNYYRSLMRSGFSTEQALQIVIAHGALPPHNSECDTCTGCDIDCDYFDDDEDDMLDSEASFERRGTK